MFPLELILITYHFPPVGQLEGYQAAHKTSDVGPRSRHRSPARGLEAQGDTHGNHILLSAIGDRLEMRHLGSPGNGFDNGQHWTTGRFQVYDNNDLFRRKREGRNSGKNEGITELERSRTEEQERIG